tara:strand:+ start:241 stop:642 length:402 start_codon:yes stop_codon:yes gene_type:complete
MQSYGGINMSFLKRIFTWWNDSTVGTSLFTCLKGKFIGEDDQGNRYYSEKNGKRRWVIYNGEIEASRIPPEWHAWLHYTVDDDPITAPPAVKSWEKEHQPNLTGTAGAYYPQGSLAQAGERPKATGDYEAWRP